MAVSDRTLARVAARTSDGSAPGRAGRRLVVAVALCLATLAPRVAHADAQAEEYFQQGKAAMVRKEYTKACQLFAASRKLEDTLGTTLNLADCHEQVGKIATAWSEFSEAEQRARAARPPQEERATYAHGRAQALRARLPKVKLDVPKAARVEGLEVSVDGKVVPPEAWELGIPVDPGTRALSATAPGKKPWKGSVRVDDEGIVVPASVPPLEDAPKAEPPPPSGQASDAAEIEAVAAARARRTAGYIVGGVGIAGLAVGGVFGGLGLSAISDERNACNKHDCFAQPTPSVSLQKETDARNTALTDINVASIAGGVGLVGLGVGIYLLVTSSPKVAPKTAVVPTVGPALRGFSLVGEF